MKKPESGLAFGLTAQGGMFLQLVKQCDVVGIASQIMLKKIHHINFLVNDLEEASSRYRSIFGVEPGKTEFLPERGVKVARFRLGDVWIILVQPTDPKCLPAKLLASEGEGFFLMSFEVDDIRSASASVKSQGCGVLDDTPRHGLDDWKVVDIDPQDTFGVRFQLVESSDS